jgi:hypothetical protein
MRAQTCVLIISAVSNLQTRVRERVMLFLESRNDFGAHNAFLIGIARVVGEETLYACMADTDEKPVNKCRRMRFGRDIANCDVILLIFSIASVRFVKKKSYDLRKVETLLKFLSHRLFL